MPQTECEGSFKENENQKDTYNCTQKETIGIPVIYRMWQKYPPHNGMTLAR